jgi:hypothetical protein
VISPVDGELKTNVSEISSISIIRVDVAIHRIDPDGGTTSFISLTHSQNYMFPYKSFVI